MLQIPLSQIPSADEFAGAVEAHRAALAAHRCGPPGHPAPRSHPLVEAVIDRVQDTNPVIAERGPDQFVVLPYEIVDDRPQEPAAPVPTLQDRKALLYLQLQQSAAAARSAVISPARVRLLGMDATEAMSVPEASRSPAQRAAIEAFTAVNSRFADIDRRLVEIEIQIEDLTEASIGGFSLPQF